tara:strand:+ start:231 stop:776 length:546 start_codon:yes stop_codon:yes gene_type:complete
VCKEILRKQLISLRKDSYVEQNLSFTKFESILKQFNSKKNLNIGGYYPINSEIECLEILEKLEEKKYKISLPIIKNKNNMDFYEWSFREPLKVSRIGIPEPRAKKKVFPDILIIPIVGFDKKKFRLGYGGGFYDRYINKIHNIKKIFTIGFAFAFQEVKTIPINQFDQKLDLILTNDGIIK